MFGLRKNSRCLIGKILYLIPCYLWLAIGAQAQSTATPTPAPSPQTTQGIAQPSAAPALKAGKEKWKIGYTVLKDTQLSQENKYLTFSIPLLVREALKDIKSHLLTEAEKDIYRKRLHLAELGSLTTKLDTIKATQDKKLFNDQTKNFYELEQSLEQKEREEIIKKIDELMKRDLKTVTINNSVVLEVGGNKQVQDPKQEQDPLFAIPFFSLLENVKSKDLDLVIWGEIEEIQKYLYLKINLFNTLLEENIVTFEYAALPDNIYELIPQIVAALAPSILGREWASLVIKPVPEDSIIEINGEVKGLGRVIEPFFQPGEYKIRIIHPGYTEFVETLTLAPREKKELAIQLKEADLKTFSLNTEPGEANIYLNSIWQGKSPLVLRLAELPQNLIIKKEGFRDLSLQLEETMPPLLNFSLIRNKFDLFERQKQKRNEFYISLGLFGLSLPIPLIFNAYRGDVYYYTKANYNEANLERYRNMQIITGAGIFLSASLFLNLFIDLIEYIQATEALKDG